MGKRLREIEHWNRTPEVRGSSPLGSTPLRSINSSSHKGFNPLRKFVQYVYYFPPITSFYHKFWHLFGTKYMPEFSPLLLREVNGSEHLMDECSK